jgi:death on curing protein
MTIYPTSAEVLAIHQEVIKSFGGTQGVRDLGALDAALIRPQLGYYKTIQEQAAALMESLAMNHPFLDGNKRVALFTTDTFLRLNGFKIECDNLKTYEYFMLLFDDNNFKYANLLTWLKNHLVDL